MKIGLISDLHLRSSTPEGRMDNIVETQFRKLKYVRDVLRENHVELLLQAGDFWDNPTPSFSLLCSVIQLLSSFQCPVYSVYGQHDMMMRSENRERTASGLLSRVRGNTGSFPLMTMLNESVTRFRPDLSVYGVNYGGNRVGVKQEIIKERKTYIREHHTIIVVIHDMIGDTPVFPGQTGFIQAEKVLQYFTTADVVLTGDFHYPFLFEHEQRYIVNTGCLLRLTRSDRDMNRQPCVLIYDTDDRSISQFDIPAEPPEKVFRVKTEAVTVDSRRLDEFIHNLKTSSRVGMSFMDNLKDYFANNKVAPDVRALIESALDKDV